MRLSVRDAGRAEMIRFRPPRSVKMTAITWFSSQSIAFQRSSSPVRASNNNTSGVRIRTASSKRIPCFLTLARSFSSCHSNCDPGLAMLRGSAPMPAQPSGAGTLAPQSPAESTPPDYHQLSVARVSFEIPGQRSLSRSVPRAWFSPNAALKSTGPFSGLVSIGGLRLVGFLLPGQSLAISLAPFGIVSLAQFL